MESSNSKMEVMKPIFYKAGIPLAITLAGVIIARIAARKPRIPEASSPFTPPESQVDIQETDDVSGDEQSYHSHGLVPVNLPLSEDDQSRADTEAPYKEEILGLSRRIEDLQERECRLEKRFLCYKDLKERERALMELQNQLILEVHKADFLRREISSLDAERERCAVFAVQYLKLLKQLKVSRSENKHLGMRFKRLLRRNKELVQKLRKQRLQIALTETEISEHKKQEESKEDCIRELKMIIEKLQGERNDLLHKLAKAEELETLKVEEESVVFEYNEQLPYEEQKVEAAEIEELIHLRWSNACLRHQLMEASQEHEAAEGNKVKHKIAETEEYGSANELNRSLVAHDHEHSHSKRGKLIAKLKQWVEGIEKGKEKGENGVKHYRRRSTSDGAKLMYLPARNSYSSA